MTTRTALPAGTSTAVVVPATFTCIGRAPDKHDFERLAVSAGDTIGLNSITSDHTAHVTLEVFDSAAEWCRAPARP